MMKRMIPILRVCLLCTCVLLPNFLLRADATCQVYFSPQDQVAERLIERIRVEKDSIKVAVYSLMHRGIAKALHEAYARGVDVEVIVDPYSIKSRSPLAKMVEKGIPVYVWNPDEQQTGNPNKRQKRKSLMHDKFCIFGNHTVWTGSFNFTREGALANRENVIVLRDGEIVESFLKEFSAIKERGCCNYARFAQELLASRGAH